MGPWLLLLTAVALAMDACAVSAAFGARARHQPLSRALPMTLSFGVWQAGMFLLGFIAGAGVAGLVAQFGRWIASAVLAWLAVRMAREAWRADDDPARTATGWPSGRTLQALGLATSLDAAAAGLGLALVGTRALGPAAVVGGVTAVLSLAAAWLGQRVGHRLGRTAEALGAAVLMGIALVIAKG